jgi:uncharacterized coiled-coil protein SlyX
MLGTARPFSAFAELERTAMSDHDLSEAVEERFQVLESKAVHTSYTVDELNSVVIRQQDQIDALIAEVRGKNRRPRTTKRLIGDRGSRS